MRRHDAEEPLVTVVVPVYNGERYLRSTLRSLELQTHSNIEVIVVDDGSSDASLRIAQESPIASTILTQPNLGVAVARNRGLARATGSWVGFVDQDDLWHSTRIESLLLHANELGVKAIASSESPFALQSDRAALQQVGDGRDAWPTRWIEDGAEESLVVGASDDEGREPVVEELTVKRFLSGAAMLTTAVLYDRETAISAGGFAPHARALDDHILNLNVARICGTIPRLSTRDLLYRVHSASTSTISPMVGPFLSMTASVRLGGVFPSAAYDGPNVDHLLSGLADAPLPLADKVALLLLTASRQSRPRWAARWFKQRLKTIWRRGSGA